MVILNEEDGGLVDPLLPTLNGTMFYFMTSLFEILCSDFPQ